MTERVVAISGKTVEVSAPGSGGGDVPAATTSTAGVVIVGDNIEVDSEGKVSVPFGTPSRLGVWKVGARLTGGSDGTLSVPVANRATAGVVKAGADLDFGTDGTINPYAATISRPGIMKQAIPVADVATIEVTDIASAQAAIAAMGTTLAELMQAMRNANQLAEEK